MQERQKVWRACRACRRKKVKCNGAQPCASCSRTSADCNYADPGEDVRLHDPEYVKSLESRLRSMQVLLNQNEERVQTSHPEKLEKLTEGEVSTVICTGIESHTINRLSPRAALTGSHAVQSPQLDSIDANPRRNSPESHTQELNQRSSFQSFHRNMTDNGAVDVTTLAEALRCGLVTHFYQAIYPIFPIIPKTSFKAQLDQWKIEGLPTNKFSTVYFMLLAVSASVLPEDDALSRQLETSLYNPSDLAKAFYTHATTGPSNTYDNDDKTDINDLIAQGLRALYLVEKGDATKAWITAGHAIRLYQGLEANHFTAPDLYQGDIRRAHGNLWWCLYILDRSLSTALGKPLAFDDDDCDSGLSDLRNGESSPDSEDAASPWFSVIADFHVTMGKIYTSIRSMGKEYPQIGGGRHAIEEASRQRIREYDAELQRYYTTQVMPKLRGNNQPVVLQTIAISSYYIGLVLLYRTSIESFSENEPDAFLRCAEAAAECIRGSPAVIASVPTSHFLVQQCRAIYASTKVLLHCMRMARNPVFSDKAWVIVAEGVEILQNTKLKWPEIKNYQCSARADMHNTRVELQRHFDFSKAFDHFGGGLGTELGLLGFSPTSHISLASPIVRACGSSMEPGLRLRETSQSASPHGSKRRRTNDIEVVEISNRNDPTGKSPCGASIAELGPLTNDFLLDFSSLTSDATYTPTLFHDDSVFLSSIDSLLLPSETWTS